MIKYEIWRKYSPLFSVSGLLPSSHPSYTYCLLYASFSGPTPTACLSWRWRTWWSWVINLTPNVSLPTCSLWSTTCADTRCPWVGPVTSDLCSMKCSFSTCVPLSTRFTSLDSSPGPSPLDDNPPRWEARSQSCTSLMEKLRIVCVCLCISLLIVFVGSGGVY